MTTNLPTAQTHTTSPQDPPDYWRQQLKTLADGYNLTFKPEMVQGETDRIWWATYYLTNPDGSNANYLGCDSGTTKNLAKEWAAYQSYATLVTLIQSWTQSAASTSA